MFVKLLILSAIFIGITSAEGSSEEAQVVQQAQQVHQSQQALPTIYYTPPPPPVYAPKRKYAAPPVYAAPAPKYVSAPKYAAAPKYEDDARYDFTWQARAEGGYSDGYGKSYESASDFGQSESRDYGKTQGKYWVELPDGRVQTVTYVVDGDSGFVAEVSHSGSKY